MDALLAAPDGQTALKQALRRQFKGWFSNKGCKAVCLKFSFKKRSRIVTNFDLSATRKEA
jgi:hypothetical protein